MAFRSLIFSALGVVLLSGCGHSLPTFPDFDSTAWRRDTYGCQNTRQPLLQVLEKHREELYGARISAVDALLGHPDEEELSEQSEKVYIYYITSGPQCVASHPRAAGPRLVLRFGATGTLTEALYPVMPARQ